MRSIVTIVLLALATGCGSSQLSSQMATWQGVQFDTVRAAWGSPDECVDIENRTVCSWHDTAAFNRVTCSRQFEFDATGIITGWRWRGDRCGSLATDPIAKTGTGVSDNLLADSRPAG